MNQKEKSISLTREELFDRIWSSPMTHLAKEFGISDRGLGKLCARLKIPVPGLGYWRKIETGMPKHKPKLPPFDGEQKAIFHPHSVEDCFSAKQTNRELVVPKQLRDPHVLVSEASRFLNLSRKERLQRNHQDTLDIRVFDASVPRALRVLDSIIKELEKEGAVIKVKKYRETIAVKDGEEIFFHIEEKSKLVVTDDPIERAKDKYYRPKRDFHETGRLSLVIDSYVDSLRRNFQDGRKQRVEDLAGEFVDTMLLFFIGAKKRTEEHLREQREWQERDKLRREEDRRIDVLKGEIQRHESKVRIKRYLSSLRREEPKTDDATRWIAWVETYLQRIEAVPHKERFFPDEKRIW